MRRISFSIVISMVMACVLHEIWQPLEFFSFTKCNTSGFSAYNLFEYWKVEAHHRLFIKHPAKHGSTFRTVYIINKWPHQHQPFCYEYLAGVLVCKLFVIQLYELMSTPHRICIQIRHENAPEAIQCLALKLQRFGWRFV